VFSLYSILGRRTLEYIYVAIWLVVNFVLRAFVIVIVSSLILFLFGVNILLAVIHIPKILTGSFGGCGRIVSWFISMDLLGSLLLNVMSFVLLGFALMSFNLKNSQAVFNDSFSVFLFHAIMLRSSM
jgi:hypothetical protein